MSVYGRSAVGNAAARAAAAQGLPAGAQDRAYSGAIGAYEDDLALLEFEQERRRRASIANALGQMAMLYAMSRQPKEKPKPQQATPLTGPKALSYSPMLERLQMEADSYKRFGAKDPVMQPGYQPPAQQPQQAQPIFLMPYSTSPLY